MQTLLHLISQHLKEHQLNLPQKRTLLAVSGGLDSAVLADLFSQMGIPFAIAHCNFQLRAEESNGDEASVRTMAERYQVPCYVTRFDTAQYVADKKVSIQAAARELRYDWLEKTRAENKYDYIATAHHLNDNAETVLYNFIKGTGVKGLRGMLVRQGRIIRPLLQVSRAAIQTYQTEQALPYREDSSNASDKYSRNKIRHHLVPLIEEINPGFIEGFNDRLKVFHDLEGLYERQVRQVDKQLFEQRGDDVYIPIRKLRKLSRRRSILYEYLLPHGFNAAQVDDMLGAMEGHSGKQFLTSTARVILDRQFLILTQLSAAPSIQLITKIDTEVKLADGTIHLKIEEAAGLTIKKDKQYAYLDMDKLDFPLLVRKRKTGDYFYPFGMKLKKKKVSKYYKDQKLPLTEKERVSIVESDKRIIWIAGERIDERFKVTDQTKRVLVMKLTKTSS